MLLQVSLNHRTAQQPVEKCSDTASGEWPLSGYHMDVTMTHWLLGRMLFFFYCVFYLVIIQSAKNVWGTPLSYCTVSLCIHITGGDSELWAQICSFLLWYVTFCSSCSEK